MITVCIFQSGTSLLPVVSSDVKKLVSFFNEMPSLGNRTQLVYIEVLQEKQDAMDRLIELCKTPKPNLIEVIQFQNPNMIELVLGRNIDLN